MNKYYHRGQGECVVPYQTFGRADHWNTESEKEHNDVYEAFVDYIASLPVTHHCSPELPVGWLGECEERYQIMWTGDYQWGNTSKEYYDLCSLAHHKRIFLVPIEAKQTETLRNDPFIQKHLDIIWKKVCEARIELFVKPMFDSLEAASVKYFLETGTVSGSFYNRLMEMMNGLRNWCTQPTPAITATPSTPETFEQEAEKMYPSGYGFRAGLQRTAHITAREMIREELEAKDREIERLKGLLCKSWKGWHIAFYRSTSSMIAREIEELYNEHWQQFKTDNNL